MQVGCTFPPYDTTTPYDTTPPYDTTTIRMWRRIDGAQVARYQVGQLVTSPKKLLVGPRVGRSQQELRQEGSKRIRSRDCAHRDHQRRTRTPQPPLTS